MATMIHATIAANLASIRRRGLLASKSRQRRKAVWLVRPGKVDWACRHAVERCQGSIEEVVVIEVEVAATAIRHHGGGLYYHAGDVPANSIKRVYGFQRCEL